MELILIRHGEAEKMNPGTEDAMRHLTANGMKLLERAIPNLRMLIKDKCNTKIWASPLLRASESAGIIAKALKVKNIESHDFIARGDFEAFSEELQRTDSKGCLIVIGHEPFLSDWSQRICGYTLPFKKGASAGFALISTDPPTGNLRWLIDLKMLGRLGD
ncbi:MAG: histidine phosphatase family protein [Eubacteriales bacterium]